MPLFAAAIFLGAFLLFQVQPIIGKMILPTFGGTAAVWTTCLLFFQGALLLGYLYAHGLSRLTASRARAAHLVLLASSLVALPIAPVAALSPTGAEDPTLRILLLLSASIGLPYVALSANGPLLQTFFARAHPKTSPYRLFSLSNAGSLLALVTYPFLLEPWLSTRDQSWLFSGLYLVFLAACAALTLRSVNGLPAATGPTDALAEAPDDDPEATTNRRGNTLLVGLLAACPSILLLAVSHHITENVVPIPLLFTLPLLVYLLSFVLCFAASAPKIARRAIWVPAALISLGVLTILPTLNVSALPYPVSIALHVLALFSLCMACHGEVARLQPPAARLTGYYLTISFGGFLGGLFVGIVAPLLLDANDELFIGLLLTIAGLALAVIERHAFRDAALKTLARGGAAIVAVFVGAMGISEHVRVRANATVVGRNFYGPLRVQDGGSGVAAHRTLMHGQIIHGRQYTHPDWQDWPIAYYAWASGVGRVMNTKRTEGPLRVGVVGLGAGTMAAYGRAGDHYVMYEIDPLIVEYARSEFTFLSNCPASLEIVMGDGRLSLERSPPQDFDVLVLDAFSGDAVPVHLLTVEGFAVWFGHLKPNGVLAVDITNRFLELGPVVQAAAAAHGFLARKVSVEADYARQIFGSGWVLVTRDAALFNPGGLLDVATEIHAEADVIPWTDDHAPVLSALR